jgi:hypothetical protein
MVADSGTVLLDEGIGHGGAVAQHGLEVEERGADRPVESPVLTACRFSS